MTQAILLYKCRLCGKRVEGEATVSVEQANTLAHNEGHTITHDCEYAGHHGIADFIGYKELPEPEGELPAKETDEEWRNRKLEEK